MVGQELSLGLDCLHRLVGCTGTPRSGLALAKVGEAPQFQSEMVGTGDAPAPIDVLGETEARVAVDHGRQHAGRRVARRR